MPPQDLFERLSLLERAQVLSDAAQRQHIETLVRQQADLARHEAMLQDYATRLARLEDLLAEQQRMHQQLLGPKTLGSISGTASA